MLGGVILDNYVLFLGSMFHLESLRPLNPIRYLAHSALLPFVVPFSYDHVLMSSAGSESAKEGPRTLTRILLRDIPFTGLLIWGVYFEYILLELDATTFVDPLGFWADYERFTSTGGPPLATIVANLVTIMGGWIVYRQSGWIWLFMASFSIFIVNGAMGTNPLGLLAGNVAEVWFIVGLLATELSIPQPCVQATPSRKVM